MIASPLNNSAKHVAFQKEAGYLAEWPGGTSDSSSCVSLSFQEDSSRNLWGANEDLWIGIFEESQGQVHTRESRCAGDPLRHNHHLLLLGNMERMMNLGHQIERRKRRSLGHPIS